MENLKYYIIVAALFLFAQSNHDIEKLQSQYPNIVLDKEKSVLLKSLHI